MIRQKKKKKTFIDCPQVKSQKEIEESYIALFNPKETCGEQTSYFSELIS